MLIDTHRSLEDFFLTLLDEALAKERVEVAEGSRSYLVQLFGELGRSEGLYRNARAEEHGTPTLTWLYERARHGAPAERLDAWRHLGDVALVVSGLFGSHLERRRSLVGVDYYVRMGAGAYGSAALCARRSGFEPIFEELAEKFRVLVDVLTRVGEATTLPVARSIERLYERWLHAAEPTDLQRRLTEVGAAPVWTGIAHA